MLAIAQADRARVHELAVAGDQQHVAGSDLVRDIGTKMLAHGLEARRRHACRRRRRRRQRPLGRRGIDRECQRCAAEHGGDQGDACTIVHTGLRSRAAALFGS